VALLEADPTSVAMQHSAQANAVFWKRPSRRLSFRISDHTQNSSGVPPPNVLDRTMNNRELSRVCYRVFS
jgi:hypothetical protein